MDLHNMTLCLNVAAEPEILLADKQVGDVESVVDHVKDFLTRFAEPDRGDQTITITIRSRRVC